MTEEWRDIRGFEGEYDVSNFGRIYSRKSETFMVGGVTPSGYRQMALRKKENRIFRYAHRLVAEAFIANPESLPQVNHIDGVKTNNQVNNLEWATAKENIDHMIRLGIQAAGIERWKKMGRPGATTPCRPVISLTYSRIEIYPSIAEAAKTNGFKGCNISLAVNDRRPLSHGRVWVAFN